MEDIKREGTQSEPVVNADQKDVKSALQKLKADKARVDEEYEASMTAVKEWEKARQLDLDRAEEAMRNRYEAIDVEVEERSDELKCDDSDDDKSMDAFLTEIDSAIKDAAERGG